MRIKLSTYVPIASAIFWCFLGLFVVITSYDIWATALFIPVCFPLSVILLFSPVSTEYWLVMLVIIIPVQNLVIGYLAAIFLKKYWGRPLFTKACLSCLALFFVFYLIFVFPLVITLLHGQPESVYETFERFHRSQIKPIPPELNAAVSYKRAIAAMGEVDFEVLCEDSDFPPDSPWNAKEFPRLAAWIRDHSSVMKMIRQGTDKGLCRGVIVPHGNDDDTYRPLENFDMRLPGISIANAGLSIRENGIDQSIPDITSAIRLLSHLEQKGDFVSSIMAMVGEQHLHSILRSVLLSDSVTKPFCRTTIQELQSLDRVAEKTIRNALLAELRSIRLVLYDIYNYPAQLWLVSYAPRGLVMALERLRWRWNTLCWPLSSPLEKYEQLLDLSSKKMFTPPYSSEYKRLEQEYYVILNDVVRRHRAMKFVVPRFADLGRKENTVNAKRRTVLLLAALRLYRLERDTYPETLSELVPDYLGSLPTDPLTDKFWIYERQDGKITIASDSDIKEKDDQASVTFPTSRGPLHKSRFGRILSQ